MLARSISVQRMMFNIGFITTLAEIVNDELVGKEVIDPATGKSFGVRRGTLSVLAEEIAKKETDFAKKFNLSSIIINDDVDDVKRHWEKKEGYDIDFTVPGQGCSRSLREITHIEPSSVWRGIPIPPRGSDDRAEVIAKRKQLKTEYEQRIVDALKKAKVDLLVSNSYTNIIGPCLLGAFKGRIINIHPAITSQDNPCRLPGVTPTRDAFTRATKGFVIVDDKKSVSLEGEEINVDYEGETRKAVKFDEEHRYSHGVTVHVVTAGVDEGPPILTKTYDLREHFRLEDSENGEKPLLTEEGIREFNYNLKPSVLSEAIMKYVERDDVLSLIKEKREE